MREDTKGRAKKAGQEPGISQEDFKVLTLNAFLAILP